MAHGNKTVLDFLRLCPTTQSSSLPDTSPDAIRRTTIGRFVAILVFSFVPFMFVFICLLCVIFRGPPLVAFNFIFLHLSHSFIYLPWQTCKHTQSETLYVCMYVVFPASIKISSWGKKCHTNTKKKTKIGGSRPSEQSRAHVQYGHLASWRFANRPINQWRHHSGDSISTSAIC